MYGHEYPKNWLKFHFEIRSEILAGSPKMQQKNL